MKLPCVSALWNFKTRDEVIPVCQYYDNSRQQMKLSLCISIMTLKDNRWWSYLCVSIMTQTFTFLDNRWSYLCVSTLWHRHWHFKTTDEVITVYQHYETDIDTSRQQMKLSLCVSITTDFNTSRQQKSDPCVCTMTHTLTLQDKRWSYLCVSAL